MCYINILYLSPTLTLLIVSDVHGPRQNGFTTDIDILFAKLSTFAFNNIGFAQHLAKTV